MKQSNSAICKCQIKAQRDSNGHWKISNYTKHVQQIHLSKPNNISAKSASDGNLRNFLTVQNGTSSTDDDRPNSACNGNDLNTPIPQQLEFVIVEVHNPSIKNIQQETTVSMDSSVSTCMIESDVLQQQTAETPSGETSTKASSSFMYLSSFDGAQKQTETASMSFTHPGISFSTVTRFLKTQNILPFGNKLPVLLIL
ncbi:hypothetical protein OUZ56_026139 [Daphnia magna]|uniref:Uncharacterized protein n=1 Tax=Daphnia magna TaxID=35525 RepID=A0ABQ9ZLQ1_9CRUS|nr:hypothetical protein OUZ56_026139 [Daphnia magna]